MNRRVKICGIKTKSAALTAAKCGADFLGFNFVFSSNRKIELESAKNIISSLSKKFRPKIVAVFMNQPAYYITQILSQIKFDILQFHGGESPKFCESFGLPYIKTFEITSGTSLSDISRKMRRYAPKYFLLDRLKQGKGKIIDIEKVSRLALRFPIMLAGALTPKNVAAVIVKAGGIKAVDVASGVESKGLKDPKKIKDFIGFAKKA